MSEQLVQGHYTVAAVRFEPDALRLGDKNTIVCGYTTVPPIWICSMQGIL